MQIRCTCTAELVVLVVLAGAKILGAVLALRDMHKIIISSIDSITMRCNRNVIFSPPPDVKA